MIEPIDPNLCNQCGVCLQVCPSDVFRREPNSGRHVIAYRDDCQTCFDCEIECPEDAITVAPWRKPRPQSW